MSALDVRTASAAEITRLAVTTGQTTAISMACGLSFGEFFDMYGRLECVEMLGDRPRAGELRQLPSLIAEHMDLRWIVRHGLWLPAMGLAAYLRIPSPGDESDDATGRYLTNGPFTIDDTYHSEAGRQEAFEAMLYFRRRFFAEEES